MLACDIRFFDSVFSAFIKRLLADSVVNVEEYCQLETFKPRCRHGEVIVMKSARFGRMRVGKCVEGHSQLFV